MNGQPIRKQLGPFSLLAPFGHDEQRALYLAVRPGARPCVVKLLGERGLADASQLLDNTHDNLVRVLHVGDDEGQRFVALELHPGRDLAALVARLAVAGRTIDLALVVHIFRAITQGLAHAHAATPPLVHGAIDASQVLISWTGEVKLLGCGLGRPFEASALVTQLSSPPLDDASSGVDRDYHAVVALLQAFADPPSPPQPEVREPTAVLLSSVSRMTRNLAAEFAGLAYRGLKRSLEGGTADITSLHQALGRLPLATLDSAPLQRLLSELWPGAAARERADRERLLHALLWPDGDHTQPYRFEAVASGATDPAGSGPGALDAGTDPQLVVGAVRPPEDAAPAPPREELTLRRSGAGPAAPAARITLGRVAPAAPGASEPMSYPEPNAQETLAPLHTSRRLPGSTVAMRPLADRPGRTVTAGDPELGAASYLRQVVAGRYRIERLLGRGGMGWVFEAEHVDVGKKVAVKVLRSTFSSDAEQVLRFRSEARSASLIGHPNIIDVLDFGLTDRGNLFLVMELLDGCDLAELLHQERRLAPERATQIAVQVCRAVAAAHEAGIVHRDLKPGNVFLVQRAGAPDSVKVLDFGIATSANEDLLRPTATGVAIGTPEYMAPEQAIGAAGDHRVDVYAIGAMLYEMLTGTPPHGGGDPHEILARKNTDVPLSPRDLNPAVPEGLAATVMQALERNPNERIGSMRALEYALTKSLHGRGSAVAAMLGLKGEIQLLWTETPSSDEQAPADQPVVASTGGLAKAGGSDESVPTLNRLHVLPAPSAVAEHARSHTPLLVLGGMLVVVTVLSILWHRVQGPQQSSASASEIAALLQNAQRAAAEERYLDPPDDNLRELLRRIFVASPNHTPARELLTSVEELLDQRGRSALDRENYELAERTYHTAYKLDLRDHVMRARYLRVLQLRAEQLLKQNRAAEAIEKAEAAAMLAPDDPTTLVILAQAFTAAGRHHDALTRYRRALELDPTRRELKASIDQTLRNLHGDSASRP